MISLESPYHGTPGFKVGGMSAAAAFSVKADAEKLREKVLDVLRFHDLTADEAANMLGESVLSIRPRVAELFKLGFIYKSGVRRRNTSGHAANVWTTGKPEAAQ